MMVLENVSKSFDGAVAVAPLTLTVAPARTLVLIGPSGCGKSTLLNMMVGLVRPDEGRVVIGGEALTEANLAAHRQRTGYVIQDGGLFPHLTARANVTLLARHLGWGADRIAARLEELAALVRLPLEMCARFPNELSGGQRQRVALMRALMPDPDLLLLDEPLAALDPMIRAGLQDELKDIFAGLGKTVVMVTHDLAEAAHFADDIALMRSGRVVQRGTMGDLHAHPADPFVSDFIAAQRRLVLDGCPPP